MEETIKFLKIFNDSIREQTCPIMLRSSFSFTRQSLKPGPPTSTGPVLQDLKPSCDEFLVLLESWVSEQMASLSLAKQEYTSQLEELQQHKASLLKELNQLEDQKSSHTLGG